jgi:hypothetical protein
VVAKRTVVEEMSGADEPAEFQGTFACTVDLVECAGCAVLWECCGPRAGGIVSDVLELWLTHRRLSQYGPALLGSVFSGT